MFLLFARTWANDTTLYGMLDFARVAANHVSHSFITLRNSGPDRGFVGLGPRGVDLKDVLLFLDARRAYAGG